MAREENMAAQERFAEGVVSGNLDVIDEVMAPDVVDHDPAPFQGPGPQGFKDFFSTMRSAFPDMNIEPEHMTATDDDVAIAYTLTGTHEGEFMGVAPTGKSISVRGVQIARLNEDAKIAERWGSSDELGIFQQLNAVEIKGEEQQQDKGLMDKARDALPGN
ncbi:MAG: ester cyclase [Rubrobacteraceae bacterium]